MVIYKNNRKCNCGRHHHSKHTFSDHHQHPEHKHSDHKYVDGWYSDHKHSCEDRHEKEHHKKEKPKKTCQESLNEFIASAAEIENALANAINAEVSLMKRLSLSPKEAMKFTEKLENLIKLAIKKEIILEFLLEETIEACKEHVECKKCSSHHCKCDKKTC
ncbi:hypothetical protein ACFOUV_07325 [Oceanobacillus longus]|uniref:Uncharacterized protein n=1 Tax=Oceanobacillus longus TaxID=930120 RepID=A0ABV8GUX2_9BACI